MFVYAIGNWVGAQLRLVLVGCCDCNCGYWEFVFLLVFGFLDGFDRV